MYQARPTSSKAAPLGPDMNDIACATFPRRLGAFVVDAVIVIALGSAVLAVAAVTAAGVLPDTPSHVIALLDAGENVDPNLPPLILLAYLVASWTRLLGHRSIGMRVAGIQTVRAPR